MSRIIATYAVRREPKWLVDELRANLAWVDGFAEIDNRRQVGGWAHEGELRARQRAACRELDADWVLFVDPDERIEDRAACIVRDVADAGGRDVVYGFALREMWTPTAYRVDGQWAAKKPRRRLVALVDGVQWPNKPIHCGLAPTSVALRRVTLDLRLYHLKNIEPANRKARAAAYLAADPDFRWQRREGRDWDWLWDETGLQVTQIEPGRGFTPAYTRPYLFQPPA